MDAIKYEVVNKKTGEVSKVSVMSFGNTDEQYVDATTEGGQTIRFSNINNEGNLLNDEYEIREVPSDIQG